MNEQNSLIRHCNWCGRNDVAAHKKYNMCEKCGKIYALYATRRSTRCANKMTNVVAKAHMRTVEYYLHQRDCGYNFPVTLLEEHTAMLDMISNIEALEDLDKIDAVCTHCGIATRVVDKQPYLCDYCAERYARYKGLLRRMDYLTQDECDELAGIISQYIIEQRNGNRIPHITSTIDKLQSRITKLGGERYKLYR